MNKTQCFLSHKKYIKVYHHLHNLAILEWRPLEFQRALQDDEADADLNFIAWSPGQQKQAKLGDLTTMRSFRMITLFQLGMESSESSSVFILQ